MRDKKLECIHCKLCTKNCEFLEKYNMDLEDFSLREDLSYNCFLCGRCKSVCPKDIDGKEIALDMRRKIVKENKNTIEIIIMKIPVFFIHFAPLFLILSIFIQIKGISL